MSCLRQNQHGSRSFSFWAARLAENFFDLWVVASLTYKDITELGDGWVANMKWKILLCYKENPHLTPDDQEQCYLRAAGRWCRFLAQCSQQYLWNCKYGLWVAVGILTVGIFGISMYARAAPVCGVWWAAECSHLLGNLRSQLSIKIIISSIIPVLTMNFNFFLLSLPCNLEYYTKTILRRHWKVLVKKKFLIGAVFNFSIEAMKSCRRIETFLLRKQMFCK